MVYVLSRFIGRLLLLSAVCLLWLTPAYAELSSHPELSNHSKMTSHTEASRPGDASQQNSLLEPRGVWMSQDAASKIEIYGCGQNLCGKIVWLSEPLDEQGRPWLDSENPDPALRVRPIVGLEFLWGLSQQFGAEWSGGTLYDAESGEVYRAKLSLQKGGDIELSGCWGFFCEASRWSRSAL